MRKELIVLSGAVDPQFSESKKRYTGFSNSEKVEINTDMESSNFLRTVIKDYNYLKGKV